MDPFRPPYLVAKIYTVDKCKKISEFLGYSKVSYIGQMALLFGANDLGSTMMEENVVPQLEQKTQ